MIVSIFHHDTRLVVELSETTSYESDDPMIQIRRIKKQYRPSCLNTRESSLILSFGSSLPRLIEVLEFSEELVCSSLACEEPAESGERRIHSSGRIDARTNLESDDIRISLYLFSPIQKIPESDRL